MSLPENLLYTEDHEWVRVEDNFAFIGITDFAQSELGDIVYVEIESVDEDLKNQDVFGTVEAVKTVSDLFMPVDGKVVEFNEALEDEPELVNQSPYDKGWMIKVELADKAQLDDLLSPEKYKELIS